MGLFDNANFDPQSYGGIGGLLSQLLNFPQPKQVDNPWGLPPTQVPPQFTPQQEQAYAQVPPQAPQVPASQVPQPQGNSLGGNLMAGFQGLVNSKSPLQGLGNLVGGLVTGQRSDPQGMYLQQQQDTLKALVGAGVPPAVALAAAQNPEILKTIAPQLYSKPSLEKLKGPLGEETPYIYRPDKQTLTPAFGEGGAGSPAGANISPLAPGVAKMDPTLTGEDYLNQFGPEVKAAVKAYMNGDVLPTGNPRLQGIAQFAKTVAQKYGADIGTPVSDALYNQRRTYRGQLGSNTPSSAGGQAKAFNQGVEHMDALANTLESLKNYDVLGIPKLSEWANAASQEFSTNQAAISDKAKGIGQTLAGEVGKLFSGSAGGGVHERSLTMERFSTVKSPTQLAAALDATLEVMKGGLTALEQRRDEVLGPNSDVKFVNKETEGKIGHIQEVIDRLKSGQAAPAQPAAPQAPKIDEVQGGYRFRGGNPADRNNWQKVN